LNAVHHSSSKEKDKLKNTKYIMNIKLQKQVISIPKQPSCERSVWPQKARVKKGVKSKVLARKWL